MQENNYLPQELRKNVELLLATTEAYDPKDSSVSDVDEIVGYQVTVSYKLKTGRVTNRTYSHNLHT